MVSSTDDCISFYSAFYFVAAQKARREIKTDIETRLVHCVVAVFAGMQTKKKTM